MRYLYYPGCSLESSALEYNLSTRAFMEAVGAELTEVKDWTCCGASAAEATSYLLSMVLAARNLALGEGMEGDGDFLIPCSACYLNLRRVEDHAARDEKLTNRINEALKEESLVYKGTKKVRHLLDVIVKDLVPSALKPLTKKDLSGLSVAPYYGCQALRPYASFDDPQDPKSMEPFIEATGARVHRWTMGARCCGAGLMTTKKEVAVELTGAILHAARGADCIVTVCPMCQMNLEAFQADVSKAKGEEISISILYLPQLLGLAFGLPGEKLRLDLNLALTDAFKDKAGVKT